MRALALISVAVKNAPGAERVWIEDIYQNIYCGASQGVRKQVGGMVAEWDSRYGRRPTATAEVRSGLDALNARATRTCENGELVPLEFNGSVATPQPVLASPAPSDAVPARSLGFVHGGAIGPGVATGSVDAKAAGKSRDLRDVDVPHHVGPDR